MVAQDAKPSKKIHVGVLFGGRSGEHEVSLASAKSIMDNIDRYKYEVVPIGITKEGEWIVGGDPMKALTSGLTTESRPATLLADPSREDVLRLIARVGAMRRHELAEAGAKRAAVLADLPRKEIRLPSG